MKLEYSILEKKLIAELKQLIHSVEHEGAIFGRITQSIENSKELLKTCGSKYKN
jgi:hypothetical protein